MLMVMLLTGAESALAARAIEAIDGAVRGLNYHKGQITANITALSKDGQNVRLFCRDHEPGTYFFTPACVSAGEWTVILGPNLPGVSAP